MSDLMVFKLQMTDERRLQHAFGILLEHDDVDSCTVDTRSASAHFTADPVAGTRLVERIYASGGLRWCSRHALDRASRDGR